MFDPRKTIVVTGMGIVSPYGIGLDCLQAGMLAGKSCLVPTKDLYPGFSGSTARVGSLPLMAKNNSHRYSRSDRLAMIAAEDAAKNFDRESAAFRASGVMMASTVAGLSEIEPEIALDPGAWYRRDDGLLRAASYPPERVAEAV